jgi:hypothetical protein
MSEAEWMKRISNQTMCGYFYVFFVVNAIIAAFTIIGTFVMLTTLNIPFGSKVFSGLNAILIAAISVTSALFFYMMCDRSLLSTKQGYTDMPDDSMQEEMM